MSEPGAAVDAVTATNHGGDVGEFGQSDEKLAYLAAVVATSADAILSKALDGTITSWNAGAERIFGYSAGEIVGKNIRRLIPDELQSEEDEILAQLRQGIFIEHYDTVRLTKDGRRLDVSLTISPIRNNAGEVIGASKIIRDVTARKQAEEDLIAASAKFEAVFNQSGIFAGILDLEGNLREINELALDLCGYTRAEVLDRPFWETPWWRGSDESRARIRFAAEQAAAGGVFRETLRYLVADGGERFVDFAMHPIRDERGDVRFLHPTGVDITERLQAEEALRAREAEEREIAIGLQRALLPERLSLPDRVSFGARYEAGSEALVVGGDWYDAFAVPGGRVALVVGDVMGHGLVAAAAMGKLRTALAALAEYADSPAELLTRLDAFLERTATTDFATVCYGVLDPSTGVLDYASAGHPPIVLVSPGGETRLLDDAQSTPLCGLNEQGRAQGRTIVEPGSLLVLYSDGLIERRDENFLDRLEQLKRASSALAETPIGEVCDRLVIELGVDSSREDDVAVLAVRYEPVTARGFRRMFPAQAEELRELRAAMRGWMDERAIADSTRSALLLTVGEACSNAIEHAYHGRTAGDVSVDIEESSDESFLVVVRDYGRYRAPSANGNDRGRGMNLMQELASDFSCDSNANGTTVRFRLPVDTP